MEENLFLSFQVKLKVKKSGLVVSCVQKKNKIVKPIDVLSVGYFEGKS